MHLDHRLKSHRRNHLCDNDWQVWRQLQVNAALIFDDVMYDVPVGELANPTPVMLTTLDRLKCRLLPLRADLCLLKDDLVLVCEVKPTLSPEAIGQAYCYATLAKANVAESRSCLPAVLTLRTNEVLLPICRRLRVHVVTPDFGFRGAVPPIPGL